MSFMNKEKKTKVKSEKSPIAFLVISLVAGILVGYLFYTLCSRVFLLIFTPCFFLAAANALNPLLIKEQKEKKKGKAKDIYLEFYHDFKAYAYLESSYQEGFRKAVDVMEISTLKDSLNEYLESENTDKVLPLEFIGSRKEAQLTDLMYRYLSSEDFSVYELNQIDPYIQSYRNELKGNRTSFDYSYLMILPILGFLLLFGLSFFPISNV